MAYAYGVVYPLVLALPLVVVLLLPVPFRCRNSSSSKLELGDCHSEVQVSKDVIMKQRKRTLVNLASRHRVC